MTAQELSYLIDAATAALFSFSCLCVVQRLIDWTVRPRRKASSSKERV